MNQECVCPTAIHPSTRTERLYQYIHDDKIKLTYKVLNRLILRNTLKLCTGAGETV